VQKYFKYFEKTIQMSDEGTVKRTFLERLQDNYRVVILDDEDLKEVSSFNLSLLIFYILLSSLIVLMSVIVISLVSFTPLKRLIPGYGDFKSNTEFVELSKKVDELEAKIKANDTYALGLANMIKSVEPNPGESNTSKSEQVSISNAEIVEAMKSRELDHLIFANPISGDISAEFDPSIGHFGTDITAPKGTAIKSIMEGIVLSSEYSLESGNTVIIQHPKNLVSIYKHTLGILVKSGQKVQTGQAIAIIGNSGERTTGPHLHLEIWYNGQPVNSKNYITFGK
jgi:murein DD-endopeptidase MepM/ murein hydrolase activator NlpD